MTNEDVNIKRELDKLYDNYEEVIKEWKLSLYIEGNLLNEYKYHLKDGGGVYTQHQSLDELEDELRRLKE